MQVIFYYFIIVVVVVIIIIFNIIIIIIILFGVNRINDRRSIDVFSCSNLFPYIYWFSFMFNTIFDKKYFPTTHSLKFQMLFLNNANQENVDSDETRWVGLTLLPIYVMNPFHIWRRGLGVI